MGQDLVLVVNDLLAAFDGLRTRHDVYKVENIAEGEHHATHGCDSDMARDDMDGDGRSRGPT